MEMSQDCVHSLVLGVLIGSSVTSLFMLVALWIIERSGGHRR